MRLSLALLQVLMHWFYAMKNLLLLFSLSRTLNFQFAHAFYPKAVFGLGDHIYFLQFQSLSQFNINERCRFKDTANL